jgi:DEAD/DEAH box helicase domain-containing protein
LGRSSTEHGDFSETSNCNRTDGTDSTDTVFRVAKHPHCRYPDLRTERRALLGQDGNIFRQPLIEPVVPYEQCTQDFPALAQAMLSASWTQQEIADLSSFVTLDLFPTAPQPRRPYTHQRDVLLETTVNGNDVVVTTGTGSGKTECFLLPIIASLVRESAAWGSPPAPTAGWDWWNHGPERLPQRAHEAGTERPAALRALIIYPLNALVEDQLGRLRRALDGDQARQWLAT